MADLFQTTVQNVNLHDLNIFAEGALEPDAGIKDSLIPAADGKSYRTKFYNLDEFISVGCRVKSHRGTQFHIWATQQLREYIVKGFALDDQRLKDVRTLPGGRAHFGELLERIRDIRASENRFYQKVCDICRTAIDYDPAHDLTQNFFATVQNKLHWPSTAAPPLRSSPNVPTPRSRTCDSPPGGARRRPRSERPTPRSRRTICPSRRFGP